MRTSRIGGRLYKTYLPTALRGNQKGSELQYWRYARRLTGQRSISFSHIVRDIADFLDRRMNGLIWREITFETALSPDIPAISADADDADLADEIERVLLNLWCNAWEAIGPHPGVVRMSTGVRIVKDAEISCYPVRSEDASPGGYAFVEVEDTGSGMDKATMARAFDPFFSTKHSTGLGLTVVKGIVLQHRGLIDVSSSPGRGSRFTALFRLW